MNRKLSGEERRAADRISNVKTWAKTVPGHAFRLALLDVYLFKQHTDILTALGYKRATGDKPRVRWKDIGNIFSVIVMFAPVGGLGAYGGPIMGVDGRSTGRVFEGFSSDTAVSVVMSCFIVALAGPLVVVWRWWRHKRYWSSLDGAYLISAIVIGSCCLYLLSEENGVEVLSAATPSLPVWGTVLLAAVTLVALPFASQGRYKSFKEHFLAVGGTDMHQVGELVAKLTTKEREKLFERRRYAVAKLTERGLIEQSQARRVESSPLGMSVTLDE